MFMFRKFTLTYDANVLHCILLNRGGGWGGDKSHFSACFGRISIKIMIKINRERSEQRKNEKN